MGYDKLVACQLDQNRNGWFQVSDTITNAMCSGGVCNYNTSLFVGVASQDNPTIQGQVTVYLREGKLVDINNPGQFQFMTKNNKQQSIYNTYAMNHTDFVYIAGECNCQNCNTGTAYALVTSRMLWNDIPQAFPMIQNPYTSNYTGSAPVTPLPPGNVAQGTFGWNGMVVTSSSQQHYFGVRTFATTTEVVLVMSKGVPIDTMASLPGASTPGVLIRFPEANQGSVLGSYTTPPITLDAGTWYVAPFLKNIPQKGSLNFQWAWAIGAPPTGDTLAAGHVVPFFALTVCLAIAATFLQFA